MIKYLFNEKRQQNVFLINVIDELTNSILFIVVLRHSGNLFIYLRYTHKKCLPQIAEAT